MSDLVVHQPREEEPIAYVGLVARADLLPKELRDRIAMRAGRRLALLLLALAVLVVVAATGIVSAFSISSGLQLAAAQSRTTQLTTQQGGFQSVRDTQRAVAVSEAAVRVGRSTAIEWRSLVGRIIAALPSDAAVSLGISVQSPVMSVPMRPSPLASPRIGDVQVTASGPDLVALTHWLDAIAADPMLSGIEVSSATGADGWSVVLTISVSPALTALTVDEEDAG